MGETNRTQILISEESAWAETPSSPTMQLLRYTSADLRPTKQLVKSGEIDASRKTTEHVKTGEGATWQIQGEYTFNTYNSLLEGALGSAFVNATITATTISALAADNSLNDTGNGFVTAGFVAGMWIRISGFGVTANNGVAKIVSVAAGKIVLADASAGGITLQDEAASESVTLTGKMLRDGTTKKSYLLEQGFLDTNPPVYLSYRGCRVGVWRLEVTANQVLQVTFSGEAEGEYDGSGSSLDASPTAATTTKICEAGSNVGSLREGGSSLTTAVQAFTIEVNNNLRTVEGVGSQKAYDIQLGDCDVSGSINAYFRSVALHNKFRSHTETSFEHRITDPDGNVTVITLPAIHYSESSTPISGKNQSAMNPLGFVAKKDSGGTHQIQIDLLAAE